MRRQPGQDVRDGPCHAPLYADYRQRRWYWRVLVGVALSMAVLFPRPVARANAAEGLGSPLPEDGAPSPRFSQFSAWTGSEMLIWGWAASTSEGQPPWDGGRATEQRHCLDRLDRERLPDLGGNGCDPSPCRSGGRYDPVTNTWRPMATAGAPQGGIDASAVWTGKELLVWGGKGAAATPQGLPTYQDRGDGAAYNPATDTWRPLTTIGAPSPRWGHTAVWTGKLIRIWGGMSYAGSFGDPKGHYGDGAAYAPATNAWTPLPAAGAPSPRVYQTAVWTGTQMLIWGGRISMNRDYILPFGDGAAYTPPPAHLPTPVALPHTGGGSTARLPRLA